MTREEARKLIGEYATGSLTESERASLLSAAIDDQELFDELANEHPIKELIDSPGARDRLIAALTPPATQPQRTWWPWAAVFAGGIVAGTVWILMPRAVEAPVQVAETITRTESTQVVVPTTPPIDKAIKPRATVPKAVTAVSAPAVPAPPPPTAEPPRAEAAAELPALRINGVPDAAAVGAKGGNGNGFLAKQTGAFAVQPFTYAFTANRLLRIVPASPGILQVTVGTQTIFARNPVVERTPIELSVPDGAASVRIEFTPTGGAAFVITPSVPQ